MQYYECGDFPFNFVFVNMDLEDVNAEKVAQEINTWLDNLPPGKTPNWVLGNHDRKRLGTRLGTQLIDIFNMISLTLPGTYNIIIIKYIPIARSSQSTYLVYGWYLGFFCLKGYLSRGYLSRGYLSRGYLSRGYLSIGYLSIGYFSRGKKVGIP